MHSFFVPAANTFYCPRCLLFVPNGQVASPQGGPISPSAETLYSAKLFNTRIMLLMFILKPKKIPTPASSFPYPQSHPIPQEHNEQLLPFSLQQHSPCHCIDGVSGLLVSDVIHVAYSGFMLSCTLEKRFFMASFEYPSAPVTLFSFTTTWFSQIFS